MPQFAVVAGLTGFGTEESAIVKPFSQSLRAYPIGLEDADLEAVLRREHRGKLPEALQAAVALNRGLRLVIRNSKDFSPQRHPFALIPYGLFA